MIGNPREWAEQWLAYWNNHDLDGVVADFADDVIFSSPLAPRILDDSDGTLRGVAQVRAYFARGFELLPELHFELVDLHAGVDTLVFRYRDMTGIEVDDVLIFEESRVVRGSGNYPVA